MNPNWQPFTGSCEQILQKYPQPLQALADRQIPALVLRKAYNPAHCAGLMRRFAERGYFSRETVGVESQLSGGPYLDLGTSLGRLGSDPEAFFAHAEATHALFAHLFEGFDDPVQTMYAALAQLAPDKQVQTACQPAPAGTSNAKHEIVGRRFGPAIFRIYHAQEGHRAHYDSVARRSKQSEYAVAHFEHQFAGVLCLQRAEQEGEPFIYDCYADAEVDALVGAGRFDDYVRKQKIARTQVQLEPGDLYFFYTENIHEVPTVTGATPRVVLAFFCAMAEDRDEIFVWS